jgi:prevent-host-death family protein
VVRLWFHVGVTQMGIRELRDNLPAVIRRVRAGEGIEVTDHGHPVARIVPINVRSQYEQLLAEGRIIPPEIDLLDVEPLPVPPGSPTASEILAKMREGERY